MSPAQQTLWVQLSSGTDAVANIATWWSQSRASLFSESLLPLANATLGAGLPVAPPAPSLPPSPNAAGTFVVCSDGVSVRWRVPAAPGLAQPVRVGLSLAVRVSDTVTLPPLAIGAAPPASAGIAQFPSEFRIRGYNGTPVRSSSSQNGLTVQLVSTPLAYVWDFGDGTSLTTASLGVGSAAPVTHTFSQSSAKSAHAVAGKYALQVTIVFDTQFLATGPGAVPGWQDFSAYGLAPLVDTTSLPYEVDQVYGVLVPSSSGG